MDLVVSDRELPGCTGVDVAGELDVYAAPVLRSALADVVAREVRAVVVDLRATTFMDSAGLGVLVAAFKRCRAAGTAMHLVCTRPNVLVLFAVTGVDRVVPLHADLDAAVAALPRGAQSA